MTVFLDDLAKFAELAEGYFTRFLKMIDTDSIGQSRARDAAIPEWMPTHMTTREDAKAALRAMGIVPTRGLIEGWLRATAAEAAAASPTTPTTSRSSQLQPTVIASWFPAAAAESQTASEAAPVDQERTAGSNALSAGPRATGETAAASQPAPSSRSLLEPILREHGALVEPPKRRKPGRPRVVASWFPAVAASMADGTSLSTALAINGITNLSKSEIRALFRNRTFKAMYQEARRRFLIENYGRKRTLRALVGRYV